MSHHVGLCFIDYQKITTTANTTTTTTTTTTTKHHHNNYHNNVGQELGPSRGVQRDVAKWLHSNPTNPSTKLCCGRRKLQTHSIPISLFSKAEGAHPALYLRSLLLRAGDVEVNPGHCAGDALRQSDVTSPPSPVQAAASHTTGLALALLETKRELKASSAGPALDSRLQPQQSRRAMGTNKQCCVCNTKMRLNSIAFRCHSCGGISHRKCANVSRYTPHVNWCCPSVTITT